MSNKKKTICALGGDGVGPEIVDVTVNILEKAGYGFNIVKPLNGDQAVAQGKEPFSLDAKKIADSSDAVIFGANNKNSTETLFYLRWTNDNFMNVRPVKYYPGAVSELKDPNGIDFVILRELSEDIYPGQEGDIAELAKRWPEFHGVRGRYMKDYAPGKFAVRLCSEKGARRASKFAVDFTLARKKAGYPGKLTCVTKSNIMTVTDGLFQQICEEEVAKVKGITYEHYYVDDVARRLVRYPKDIDVMLCCNLFGDILSDEAAEITGGLGLAGSSALGGKVPLYEPSHGSAPKYAGKNVINPTATILSAKMMLEDFGMKDEAVALENAVIAVYKERKHLTYDQGGKATTTEFGEAVLAKIK